jgi:single-stranded-DNA-specific exonuclease
LTDSLLPKNWWTFPSIPEKIDRNLKAYPKYLRQVLYNRGITDPDSAEAYLTAADPGWDPFLLNGMDKTVERLLRAVDEQEAIAVYGDYDVDGVTATALMVQVLQKFSARVTRFIPDRFEEGYGLNNNSITLLHDSDARVILTVDCGIRSPREAEHARSLGIDLIISDHHFPKYVLPDAYAIVCPKQEGDGYPYKELAGVGLAYKIAQALFRTRKAGDWQANDWLDLVALGTVSDLVPLTGENRSLVKRGIQQIRYGQRIGISALAGVSGKDIGRITATDIGYALGPRLNASGRMDSALKSYDLLVTDKRDIAGYVAQELDDQNGERQKATRSAQEKAESGIDRTNITNLLSTFDEEFSSGIVGLVASKLTEHFYRPAIVGSIEGDLIRASCRSISEFHITSALDECADLLIRHGGHSMAAGFTVHKDLKDQLLERMNSIADRELSSLELRPTVKIDLDLEPKEITPQIYSELEKLQPTGMGNPSVLLALKNVDITGMQLMGKEKNHIRFAIPDAPINLAVAFNQGSWYEVWIKSKPKFDLAFTIEINVFNGKETQQIHVKDMKLSGTY